MLHTPLTNTILEGDTSYTGSFYDLYLIEGMMYGHATLTKETPYCLPFIHLPLFIKDYWDVHTGRGICPAPNILDHSYRYLLRQNAGHVGFQLYDARMDLIFNPLECMIHEFLGE